MWLTDSFHQLIQFNLKGETVRHNSQLSFSTKPKASNIQLFQVPKEKAVDGGGVGVGCRGVSNGWPASMMIRNYVIKYQFIQNAMLKLLAYHYSLQLIQANTHTTNMFQNHNHPLHEQFPNQEDSTFGLLEKSQTIHHLHHLDYLPNAHVQNNFEEIFITDFAPNWSNVSVCTQEDQNVETLIVDDDFFGESVDHFFNDNLEKQAPQEKENVQPASNIQKKENRLQQQSDAVKSLTKNQSLQKQEQAQSTHDQTKNIPKNYIKAIFSFILQNQQYMVRLASHLSQSQSRFIQFVKQQKKVKKYTIQRLKSLWTHLQNGKLMRIVSAQFLRKRCLGYIFASKIEKKMSHIRHRLRFIRAIENPSEFNNIK